MKAEFKMPDYWTPDQATEIYELLQTMQAAIWNQYQLQIMQQIKSERIYETDIDIDEDDLPF